MNVLEELKAIVNDYKGEELTIAAETTFEDLGFDSLDKVDLMMQIEEKFEITLGDDLVVNTVGDLVKKIEEIKQ